MRLHWIDTLKGIGIILVVLAHHSLPVALDTYIFAFHMPLFFFISGYLFNLEKYGSSASKFARGRFNSLIIPYFCFALLTCLFYFLLDTGFQPGVTNIEFFENNALYGIYSILYALGPMVSYNPPLWFLTCLFVTELLFYGFAKKYYWEPKKLIFLLGISGVVGYLYSVYIPFRVPWNADVALAAVVFYGAGNLFRKFTESKGKLGEIDGSENSSPAIQANLAHENSGPGKRLLQNEKLLAAIFIFINLFYLAYLLEFPTSEKVNMNVLKYGGFFSFYILAFSGIFTFVYLSRKIRTSKILEFYGRNSLIVLALHFPLKDVFSKLTVIVLGIDLEAFYYNAGFALSLTILNLLCLVPVVFIINNYLPFLIGKKASPDKFESFRARLKKYVS